MATYAIGDVQGCYDSLCALLARVGFDPACDRLWFAGDLVNRGPRSLEVLRAVRGLGERAVVVLGNHDLHLLGRAAGVSSPKRNDTLDQVLAAPDADELLSWLGSRPLFHEEGDFALVHAGLLPAWDLAQARARAQEVEAALGGAARDEVLRADDEPVTAWRSDLPEPERLRAITTVLTRIRTCREDGELCASFSGPPEEAPAGCHPWFSHPRGARRPSTLLFGHWAALGFRRGEGYVGLDSGCVWGGPLTALRLDDGEVFQEPAARVDAVT